MFLAGWGGCLGRGRGHLGSFPALPPSGAVLSTLPLCLLFLCSFPPSFPTELSDAERGLQRFVLMEPQYCPSASGQCPSTCSSAGYRKVKSGLGKCPGALLEHIMDMSLDNNAQS